MPFILEKNNAEYEQIEIAPLTLSFVEQIPSELTFDFVEKHKLAKEEITQEIMFTLNTEQEGLVKQF